MFQLIYNNPILFSYHIIHPKIKIAIPFFYNLCYNKKYFDMSKNAYILSWTKEFIAMSEIFSLISKYISIITKQICEKYGYDEQTALRNFTSSETCRMLKNPELEMWEFCPDIIFEMWECEQITGNPRNSIYIRSK